jgi:hypothetical protein
MNIEFRQFVPHSNATANALGLAMHWTPWTDVPTVVEQKTETEKTNDIENFLKGRDTRLSMPKQYSN